MGEESHYLRVYVRALRRKLGDEASAPRLILTEPGVGYRWIAAYGPTATRRSIAPAWPTQTRPGSSVLKRILVGRAMASSHLEHTLLPEDPGAARSSAPTRCPPSPTRRGRSSSCCSIVEPGVKHLVMPISIAIAALMAIVVVSYRQTVRAYPIGRRRVHRQQGEPRDAVPASSRPRALLVDYMMTVVVSIVAGVFAITSALPASTSTGCGCRSAFVWLHHARQPARGTRSRAPCSRSPPTGSSRSILVIIALGLVAVPRRVSRRRGDRTAPRGRDARRARSALFVILHAFSSGATALTGRGGDLQRRAGVPTPAGEERGRDARDHGRDRDHDVPRDLLARDAHRGTVTVSDERTVIAQIAYAVFGGGLGFYVVSVLHGRDPDPGREHRVPGLPPPVVDPGARPVHAEPVHEPRRPARLLERHRGARAASFAILIYRVRCEPHAAHPALRDRRVHLVHALADRHGACTG